MESKLLLRRIWNNGIVEQWNVVFKGILKIIDDIHFFCSIQDELRKSVKQKKTDQYDESSRQNGHPETILL